MRVLPFRWFVYVLQLTMPFHMLLHFDIGMEGSITNITQLILNLEVHSSYMNDQVGSPTERCGAFCAHKILLFSVYRLNVAVQRCFLCCGI